MTKSIIIISKDGKEYLKIEPNRIKDYIRHIYKNWIPATGLKLLSELENWKQIYRLKNTNKMSITNSFNQKITLEE